MKRHVRPILNTAFPDPFCCQYQAPRSLFPCSNFCSADVFFSLRFTPRIDLMFEMYHTMSHLVNI